MYILRRTEKFDRWLRRLKDVRAKARIIQRLDSVSLGNFGDATYISGEVWELRFHFGPGYRVYYLIDNEQIVLLLVGGKKDTQSKDIENAIALAQSYIGGKNEKK